MRLAVVTVHPSDAIKTLTATAHEQVLRPVGFKKRRHSFRRSDEPGLVQVVEFQMYPRRLGDEPYDCEASPVGRALRLGYGTFTINLGVYIQEVRDASEFAKFDDPKYPTSASCHIRTRIGTLMPEHEDWWWSLQDVDLATAGTIEALNRSAMPWLESLRTRQGIVNLIDGQQPELSRSREYNQKIARLVRQAMA